MREVGSWRPSRLDGRPAPRHRPSRVTGDCDADVRLGAPIRPHGARHELNWLDGAVACFLALAVVGLTSPQPLEVQAAYVAMELICWMVIVPLSLLSPLTGVAQSLWTPWGMLKHYWVVVKLLVTLPCTAILLLHMLPTTRLASVALQGGLAESAMHDLRVQLVADSAAAIVVLAFTTVLAVYKPRGQTSGAEPMPAWVKVLRGMALVGVAAFLVAHLLGGGMGHHGMH